MPGKIHQNQKGSSEACLKKIDLLFLKCLGGISLLYKSRETMKLTRLQMCGLVSIFVGAQWLSWYSVRLGIEGLLVVVSRLAESLGCVLAQKHTLSTA